MVQANGKVRDRLEVPDPADLGVADAGLSGEHHQTAARPDVASSSAACGPADGESMASQLAAVKKAPSAEGALSIFGAWQKKSAFSNSLKTLRYKRMREAVLSSFCA